MRMKTIHKAIAGLLMGMCMVNTLPKASAADIVSGDGNIVVRLGVVSYIDFPLHYVTIVGGENHAGEVYAFETESVMNDGDFLTLFIDTQGTQTPYDDAIVDAVSTGVNAYTFDIRDESKWNIP